MACADMELEAGFLAALESATEFRVLGRHLELFDDAHTLLARLEERNLD
jgi:hypothetical protein